MQEVPIVLGFTAGELTPRLASRFDLQAYQRGAAEISNFQIQPYGGVQQRPGTVFVTRLSSPHVRLHPFYYSEEDTLLLEFFPGGMHVYRDGRQLMGSDGSAYVLDTPWNTAEQIASLHFNQVNDVIYVCCPSCPPVRLCRYEDTSWACAEPDFNVTPRESYALQKGNLSVAFEANGIYAKLTISGGELRFASGMAGEQIILADATIPGRTLFAGEIQASNAHEAPDVSSTNVARGTSWYQADSRNGMVNFYRCIRTYTTRSFNGSRLLSDYPAFFQPGIMLLEGGRMPYEVAGDWELSTTGTWNACWEIWRSYDTPDAQPDFYLWDWTCVKSFSQSEFESRQNWAISGSEERPCRMVLVCRSCSDATKLDTPIQFKILGGVREYRLRITSVTTATEARARVTQTYMGAPVSFATHSWSFAALGYRNGYPAFSAIFQGRLWLGGIPGLPTTILASVTDDFHNFRMGSNDDSAMHLGIMGSDQSRVCWMCATRQLLIGTSDSEWVLVSGTGNMLTPSSISIQRQSSVGSESLPAHAVENTVLFVQRGGRRMREIAYRLESDGFSATDISMLAEHLFSTGVREWCVQRGSHFNIWVLMQDYSIAVLTINMEQQVTAWQRVEMKGRRVLTMAALQSSAGKEDEMWFAVQLEQGGGVVMERMGDDSPHLDSMVEVKAGSGGGLVWNCHLDGLELLVVDSVTQESVRAVASANGFPQLAGLQAGRTYRVGLPIRALLQTMPLETNASFNAVRQFSRFKLRLLESDTHFDYRSTANDIWETMDPGQHPDVSPPYSGAVRLPLMPDAGVGQSLCIRYEGHRNFCILAITQEVDFHGK